jgi:hypothetical protein
VTERTQRPTVDPLVAALARYVAALDRRYPEGPVQLCHERLDSAERRANITRLRPPKEKTAA